MENSRETFSYTYSARQQEEIKSIRKKYMPPQEDKLEQLRRLHNSATRRAQSCALTLGILGALIMGSGMSLVMSDIGNILGITNALLWGIVIGLAGMIPVVMAYPAYRRVLERQRRRIAPEVIRLSDELLK